MSDPTDPPQSQPDDSRQPSPHWQPPGPPYSSPPPPSGVPPQAPPPGWQPPPVPWQVPGGPPPGPPSQPPGPPTPRRSWPARHKIWTAVLSVVAVGIVVGVVVTVVGSKPNGTSAGTSAASSPSPSAASLVTDPNGVQCTALDSTGYCPGDPSPTPDPEANWEQNSPGYQSWLDVGSDVYQIGQDGDAGNTLAMFGVGGDGFKLAQAAGAALQDPSPVDTRDYKKAMANFGFMGVSLTNGNVSDAANFAKKALKFLQAWATAAQPGATGSSGCGDWNLPQSSNCG